MVRCRHTFCGQRSTVVNLDDQGLVSDVQGQVCDDQELAFGMVSRTVL